MSAGVLHYDVPWYRTQWREAMCHTRLIGLKGNEQVLLDHRVRSPAKWVAPARMISYDRELVWQWNAFWQLTRGCFHVSRICHQSYQLIFWHVEGERQLERSLMWCKGQAVSSQLYNGWPVLETKVGPRPATFGQDQQLFTHFFTNWCLNFSKFWSGSATFSA